MRYAAWHGRYTRFTPRGSQDQQRLERMEAEAKEAHAANAAKAELRIQALESELAFKSHEALQAKRQRTQLQRTVDELVLQRALPESEAREDAGGGGAERVAGDTPPARHPSDAPPAAAAAFLGALDDVATNSPLFQSRPMRPSPTSRKRRFSAVSPSRLVDGERASLLHRPHTVPQALPATPHPHQPAAGLDKNDSAHVHGVACEHRQPGGQAHGGSAEASATALRSNRCVDESASVPGVDILAAPVRDESEGAAWLSAREQQSCWLLARLLSTRSASLHRLLHPQPSPCRAEAALPSVQAERSARQLCEACELIAGGAENAPYLLCALQQHLVRAWEGELDSSKDILQFVYLLLVESPHCRRSVIATYLPSAILTEVRPDCSTILPTLMEMVEFAATTPPRAKDLLPTALDALCAIFWCERLVCLPRLCDWISLADARTPVFGVLLAACMPPAVRNRALDLLRLVLTHEVAFECFLSQQQGGPRESPHSTASQVAFTLNTVDDEHGHDMREWLSLPTARFQAVPASQLEEKSLTSQEGGSSGASFEGRCSNEKTSRQHNAQLLRHASIRLFSMLVATHHAAANRLVAPSLNLSLPMRLVSTLHLQVSTLLRLRGREPSLLELALVQDSVMLLLELSRGVSIQRELEGGSWTADLISTTGYLIRNEVHPLLVRVALPAKLLQNAIKAKPQV